MQIIRKCNSMPAMEVHAFSTKPVCTLNRQQTAMQAVEKAGFIELHPRKFGEWVTTVLMTHYLCQTDQASVFHNADVASWIGEPQTAHAQDNICFCFTHEFDTPGGILVLLVALYYVTSHPGRFNLENLTQNVLDKLDELDEDTLGSQLAEFAVFTYGSAVWLATTWLLDDASSEKRFWGKRVVSDEYIQTGRTTTRRMLNVLDHRLRVDQEDFNGWMDQVVEKFPFESF